MFYNKVLVPVYTVCRNVVLKERAILPAVSTLVRGVKVSESLHQEKDGPFTRAKSGFFSESLHEEKDDPFTRAKGGFLVFGKHIVKTG